jgi:hypothetical protein
MDASAPQQALAQGRLEYRKIAEVWSECFSVPLEVKDGKSGYLGCLPLF